MKKLLITALAVALTTAATPETSAPAGAYVTTFGVYTTVGGHEIEQGIPTPAGKRFALPTDLDMWNCRTTDKYLSDTGAEWFVNVICVNTNDDTVVGDSISCPVSKEGLGISRWFIRRNNASVSTLALCQTSLQGSAPVKGNKL